MGTQSSGELIFVLRDRFGLFPTSSPQETSGVGIPERLALCLDGLAVSCVSNHARANRQFTFDGDRSDFEHLGHFFLFQATKEPQFHYLRCPRCKLVQAIECFIHNQQIVELLLAGQSPLDSRQRDLYLSPAPLG